jgi:ribosome-binding protein aMBF1 (putative translation factor)
MDLNKASSVEILDRPHRPSDAARPRRKARRAMPVARATTRDVQAGIGLAIRRRRRLIDMTLRALADACGVSFQQIHKYESGQCSISAVQLWRIGSALGVPVTYFFERVTPADLS